MMIMSVLNDLLFHESNDEEKPTSTTQTATTDNTTGEEGNTRRKGADTAQSQHDRQQQTNTGHNAHKTQHRTDTTHTQRQTPPNIQNFVFTAQISVHHPAALKTLSTCQAPCFKFKRKTLGPRNILVQHVCGLKQALRCQHHHEKESEQKQLRLMAYVDRKLYI